MAFACAHPRQSTQELFEARCDELPAERGIAACLLQFRIRDHMMVHALAPYVGAVLAKPSSKPSIGRVIASLAIQGPARFRLSRSGKAAVT